MNIKYLKENLEKTSKYFFIPENNSNVISGKLALPLIIKKRLITWLRFVSTALNKMEYLIKICLALILFASCADDNLWLDLNKNNIQDDYENPSLAIDVRIEDLMGRMTIE